jgi:hypothetical protein
MRASRFLSSGLALIAMTLIVGGASAQVTADARISSIHQEDMNEDGTPNLTVMEGAFMTQQDRVLVFDGGGDMLSSDDWRQATDFINDVWVFDANADGSAQLIIQFVSTDTGTEARLFDDANGDGTVSYQLTSTGGALVSETRFPGLIVRASGDWLRSNGSLNYDLEFLQDGAYYLEEGMADFVALLQRDGSADYQLKYLDENGDGIPEAAIKRLLTEAPRVWGISRFGVEKNEGQLAPQPSTASIFWPFLGRDPNARLLNYFEMMPTIRYDWEVGRITGYGNSGYPIEHGYHINSLKSAMPNVRSTPDFENMMAYYDLDNDRDRHPELFVRHRYYESDDLFGEGVSPALNEIRYSWVHGNVPGLLWDYKLGLAGRHLIDSTVRVGEFDLGVVPYESLPGWVVGNTWDMVTFVAREAGSYFSSEGIYEWAPIEEKDHDVLRIEPGVTGQVPPGTIDSYIRGRSRTPPEAKFNGMRVGYRGEYNLDYGRRIRLYISPVDRKLHLFGAIRGLWQLSDRSQLRYSDVDKDGYLDQWVYEELDDTGRLAPVTSLNVSPSYVVFSDAREVLIRRADSADTTVYEALPPTDPVEQQALEALLREHGSSNGTVDFAGMLAQFAGEDIRIQGASVREFRPISGGGFRFVLDLAWGWSQDSATLLDLGSRPVGAYVVTYHNGFTVEQLTPPNIELELLPFGVIEAQEAALLPLAVSNRGSQDLFNAVLVAERHWESETIELDRRNIDVLAGETTRIHLPWWAAPSTTFDLTVRLERPANETVAQTRQSIAVASGAEDRGQVLRAALGSSARPLAAIVPLLGLALLAGFLTVRSLMPSPEPE